MQIDKNIIGKPGNVSNRTKKEQELLLEKKVESITKS
jgi:hypothetical protein